MPLADPPTPHLRDAALRSVLQAVIIAGQPDGQTGRYFAAEAWWQAPLRHRCGKLIETLAGNPAGASEEGVALLQEVNGRYHTRQAQSALPGLFEDFESVITQRGWLERNPPGLLECRQETVSEIAAVYLDILRLNSSRDVKRPCSLLTKWLHLCFPATFVIYDRQAARSVLAWSQCAYPNVAPQHPERLQFDVDNRHWVRHWDDPGWYIGLLLFYRLIWAEAQVTGCAADVSALAESLQRRLRCDGGGPSARLTILDVIDGLLWSASGDPALLGFRTP